MPVNTSAIDSFMTVVRKEILQLPKYNAGLSLDYVRTKYGIERISKLGSNENPYGPSPLAIEAMQRAAGDVYLYPDASCEELRQLLAHRLSVSADRLIFGNGSEDLIAVICHTFLAPGQKVVTFAPSFGLHVIWPQSVGAEVLAIPAGTNYRMDIQQVLSTITPTTRMVIFGNPSNPVGTSLSVEELRSIMQVLSPKTLLVFDEAYLEYAKASGDYPNFLAVLQEYEQPWILLRTFSKAYGLAGLRIGYAVASHVELIELMDRVRAPFNVNRIAQTALLAALQDQLWTETTVTKTIQERKRVADELRSMGTIFAPSLANFLFIKSDGSSDVVAEELLRQGVIVKPWRESGWSDHIRVSIGTAEQNDHFLQAWNDRMKRRPS